MSDELNETTETPETTDAAEPTDATESVTASAPARSTDEVAARASGAPASSPDASASELSNTASELSIEARPRRKARDGFVVSNSMDKTVVVAVIERVRHPKYNKFVLQTKRLYAHDETNDVNVGDKVRVMETRPWSKSKRWRVTDVLERAK